MKTVLPPKGSFATFSLRFAMPMLLVWLAITTLPAQTPYSNFTNKLFIPDTLSTWPPNTHSVLHLDVTEDEMVLFPNASASNPAIPGFAYRPEDNNPIPTIAYSSPGVANNPGILGPTLIWWVGDSVTMEVQNHLQHPTTTHWHGAHVAPWNDGGPHQVIPADSTWRPSFKIRDDVSTMWYHPHLHHHTQEQVQKGMAGMIIVKDVNDPNLNKTPRTYGANDFPLVIQDKFVQYDPASGRDTINTCCSMGTIPLVNGTWQPYLEVMNEGWIRLRILNGSSERSLALSLQHGSNPNALIEFYVIASDAGYLNQIYNMNGSSPSPSGNLSKTLIVMPSERYEIIFDGSIFPPGDSLFLVNRRDWMKGNKYITTFAGGPSYDNPSCYSGPFPTTMPDTINWALFGNDPCAMTNHGWMVPTGNFDSLPMPLLKIVPIPMPNVTPLIIVPITLANWQIPDPATADTIRTKKLVGFNPDTMPGHGPPFSIDSVNYKQEVVNDFINLGATEIWDVYNSSGVAHPLHIHDIHFFITEIEYLESPGNSTTIPVPPYMQGPKDVMAVASSADNGPGSGTLYPQVRYRLIGTWEDFAVPGDTTDIYKFGYMYHCHILDHEDGGMMHQFVVVSSPPLVSTNAEPDAPEWLLAPNPTTGRLSMQAEFEKESLLQLYDQTGKLVRSWNLGALYGPTNLDLGVLPDGMYLLRWMRPDGESSKRVVVLKK